MSRSLKRTLLGFLLTALTAYAGLCLVLFLYQGRLVYFPGPPPTTTPAALGLKHRELHLVTSDGVRIHAWFLPAPAARGALVFCHGNAGNIEHRLHAARAFLDMGLSVLLFDYRGYGASEGHPTEAGTYLDAEAAYAALLEEPGVTPTRIVIYGESLGAGVALELARRREVAAVVTEAAFTSLPDLGSRLYPWLPVRLLSRFRYHNLSKVASLDAPLLVIHSPDDDIVPYAHGQRLFAAAAEPKQFLETEGGHNDGGFLRRDEWRELVSTFLDDVLREAR